MKRSDTTTDITRSSHDVALLLNGNRECTISKNATIASPQESFASLRGAMHARGRPMYIVDRSTLRFVDANDAACALFGCDRATLLGMGPADVLPLSTQQIQNR